MSASLDKLALDLAEMRATLESPSFRCRTAKEHRNALRIDISNLIPGPPIAEPDLGPPCKKSLRAKAALFTTLRRLEREALALSHL